MGSGRINPTTIRSVFPDGHEDQPGEKEGAERWFPAAV